MTVANTEQEAAKILIVDDRKENLLTLQAVLERPDYRFVLASSGTEALAAVLRHDLSVVLLDVAMPDLDGFATATLIRQRTRARHLPIIFVTGVVSDVEHVFRGYTTGAVDYLTKPFDPYAVRAKVAAFVELWRHRRAVERTSAALQEAEYRARMLLDAYRVTFEEAPIGIGHVSLEGRWMRVNPRLAEILGRASGEIVRHALRDDLAPADRETFDADLRKLIGGVLSKLQGEYRFVRADGSLAWVALTISLIRDAHGRPVQLALVEDVTEEKRLSEALAVSERRFARLAEVGLLGVFEQTRDGTIEAANSAFLDMIGYSADEVRARRVNLRSLTPSEYDEADRIAWRVLEASGICHTYEKELTRRDGRRISVLVGGVGTDGTLVGCALDVTAIKEVERERARVMFELQDSLRARDDFISLAAHELRTPLTPLLIRIDVMLKRAVRTGAPIDPAELAAQLVPMRRAAQRMSELVDDLLEVSRMTVGHIPLDLKEVDLGGTVREVVERMRPQIDRAGCVLSLRADDPISGRWDRTRLEQVVANLVSNAIKYGANAPVEIVVEASGDLARFSVRDHGIGIAPEDRARIFERFERVSQAGQYGGFGIGLWVVRWLVEAHGGSVRVESRPGEGSRFTVEIPRTAPRQLRPRTSDAGEGAVP
jgi:PAS domain S-box-containing protein